MRSFSNPSNLRRSGFTLIEILVVMVIIAILVGLGIGLLGSAGQQARIAQTQATLKHLDAIISQRTESFRTANLSKIVDSFITFFKNANSMATISPQDRKAIEILVRKNLYKQLFPMKPADLYGMDGNSGTWDDAPNATSIDNTWTAAELLFWSMTQGTAYGLSPVTTDGIPSNAIATSPNNSNRRIFVDGWGNPIEFYRWPTRLISGNPTTARILIPGLPSPTNKDPDDPLKVISNTSMSNKFATTFSMSNGMSTLMMQPFTSAAYHDLNVYHTPLLVSPGPDGDSGITSELAEVTMANTGAAADDITNRQGR